MNEIPGHLDTRAAFRDVVLHSCFWLFVTCAVGVLLAVELLVPSVGAWLSPLTYGRWVTVHLNAGLYGWSAIPLIGLIFLQYLPRTSTSRPAAITLSVWSGVLLFSAIGWLSGQTSGKLFMEWTGASRWAVLIGMVVLAAVLWHQFFARMREDGVWRSGFQSARFWLIIKIPILLTLSSIPFIMYKSADPALYPPVNPDSGGATGGSLLGSSLAIVLIYWITPMVLDLPTSKPWRSFMPSLFFLMVHTGAFLMLDHGDHSHHETVQIAALTSLVIWVPVLVRHLRKFSWPEGSRMWLIAFAAWALFLLVSGLFTFMPGILDRWKFTNALVAHSHIAMAGMISSFNMIVLTVLSRGTIAEGVFEAVLPFGLWQSGDIIQSAALLTAGTLESAHPDWLFTGHVAMRALYAARLAGGVLMLAASAYWLYATHLMKEDETT